MFEAVSKCAALEAGGALAFAFAFASKMLPLSYGKGREDELRRSAPPMSCRA
jgi:hypothetical protein